MNFIMIRLTNGGFRSIPVKRIAQTKPSQAGVLKRHRSDTSQTKVGRCIRAARNGVVQPFIIGDRKVTHEERSS